MQPIPPDVSARYTGILRKKGVSVSSRDFYMKWLSYFLDFCHKYGYESSDPESIKPFIDKLRSKKQSSAYQRQAHHAVILYLPYLPPQLCNASLAGELRYSNNPDAPGPQ